MDKIAKEYCNKYIKLSNHFKKRILLEELKKKVKVKNYIIKKNKPPAGLSYQKIDNSNIIFMSSLRS
jgi:hypothetical protein